MSTFLDPIDLFVFLISTVLTGSALTVLHQRRRKATHRLRELSSFRERSQSSEPVDGLTGLYDKILPRIAGRLLPANPSKRSTLQLRMYQAGFTSPASIYTFAIIRLMLAVLPFLVVSSCFASGFLSPKTLLMLSIAGAGVGFLTPSLWLDYRKRKRQQLFVRSLPDFFDLLTTCIESGLALEASVKRVSVELTHAHPVLAAELLRVDNQISLGTAPNDAFESFAERSDLDCLRSFASLIRQTRLTGASMGEALRVNAEMMRTQREQRAEESAQKASVMVMIPTLLLIFPTVFIALAGPAMIQLSEKFGASEAVSSEK
ncbi:type II secretion system F family protein [Thalassoroseus pseudoceratinae]|uniref:type II secretion system F family protein n=1 Tax=Thalassoroseus pseudoceratinae TaxID=2713176 RepID=UPI0014241ACF|nr:type II secretion system F family protein [Thalassoroseus pseudoceratinae]